MTSAPFSLFSSLRSRLLLLVMVAILPSVLGVIWLTEHERDHARSVAHDRALELSRELVKRQELQVEATRQLLAAMTKIQALQFAGGQACAEQLQSLYKSAPPYLANFAIIQPDGQIECSALPMKGPLNVADRAYFREALSTKQFAVSGYQIGRITGRPILSLVYPATDSSGKILFLAYASLDLSWINNFWTSEQLGRSTLPAGASLTVVDPAGTILVRHPDPEQWVGRNLPDNPVVKQMLGGLDDSSQDGSEGYDGTGIDSVVRLYGYSPLEVAGRRFGILGIGIPHKELYADIDRHRHQWLVSLTVACLALFILTWVIAEHAILRRLQPIFIKLQHLAKGEFLPRSESRHGIDELGQLGERVEELSDYLHQELIARTCHEQALRNTTNLLRTIFNCAPFIILVIDEEARVLETNLLSQTDADNPEATLSRLCGQALQCAHLNRDGLACGTAGECRGCPIRAGISEVVVSGKTLRDREATMTLLRDGAEKDCHFSLTVSPLQGLASRVFLITLIDITERKHAEAQQLELERQLLHTQKLESLGILAGSVAHDFNNLLMAILGHLDLVDARISGEASVLPHLSQAKSATRQAAELTRQLLTYAGRGQLASRPVDLAGLVRANTDLLQISIGKMVSLQLEMAEELSPVIADPGQLQQVVMNLITNASDAIGQNPGTIHLALYEKEFDATALTGSYLQPPSPAGCYVVLEVSDTGCGMDKATQQRIFDPFFSTKQTGQGLGMSSLLGIVKNMRGTIFIDSAPDRGTTIRLLFPIADPATIEARTVAVKDAAEQLERRKFYGTLLIVDDEEMVRLITAEYARMFGFDVLTAVNGEEGVRLFLQHSDQIACILLDLTMPVMDGLEAFRRIRKAKPNIPVILASGYIEEEATERFFGEGLSAFIQKPYDKNDLRQKLAEVFANSESFQSA